MARMNNKSHKYWILVASKNHVARGIKEGIAQAGHGKKQPLKRMQTGDGVIYYSPKLEFETNIPCQEFTAIGLVVGDDVYAYDMGNGFIPYRRKIRYLKSKPVQIKSLIEKLEFVTDKNKWGYKFRFGAFEISEKDFKFIAKKMRVKLQN
jgi:hypothetical protein